jgi:tRNA-specific 2-thiouridylase
MDGGWLTFDAPEYGVAPGQAAVLYDADDPTCVLGGGWIESTRAANLSD